jgi:hypothetical protein
MASRNAAHVCANLHRVLPHLEPRSTTHSRCVRIAKSANGTFLPVSQVGLSTAPYTAHQVVHVNNPKSLSEVS